MDVLTGSWSESAIKEFLSSAVHHEQRWGGERGLRLRPRAKPAKTGSASAMNLNGQVMEESSEV